MSPGPALPSRAGDKTHAQQTPKSFPASAYERNDSVTKTILSSDPSCLESELSEQPLPGLYNNTCTAWQSRMVQKEQKQVLGQPISSLQLRARTARFHVETKERKDQCN